jgi:hypothetical protein
MVSGAERHVVRNGAAGDGNSGQSRPSHTASTQPSNRTSVGPPQNRPGPRRGSSGLVAALVGRWFPFWLPLAMAALFIIVMAAGHLLVPSAAARGRLAAARLTGLRH